MINLVFIISSLIISMSWAVDDPSSASVLEYSFSNDGSGEYSYGFKTSDAIEKQEEGSLKNANKADEAIIVKGHYSYVDGSGRTFTVFYTADENGFHPEGEHIKVPPFVPWVKGQPHYDEHGHAHPLSGPEGAAPLSRDVNGLEHVPPQGAAARPSTNTNPVRITLPPTGFAPNVENGQLFTSHTPPIVDRKNAISRPKPFEKANGQPLSVPEYVSTRVSLPNYQKPKARLVANIVVPVPPAAIPAMSFEKHPGTFPKAFTPQARYPETVKVTTSSNGDSPQYPVGRQLPGSIAPGEQPVSPGILTPGELPGSVGALQNPEEQPLPPGHPGNEVGISNPEDGLPNYSGNQHPETAPEARQQDTDLGNPHFGQVYESEAPQDQFNPNHPAVVVDDTILERTNPVSSNYGHPGPIAAAPSPDPASAAPVAPVTVGQVRAYPGLVFEAQTTLAPPTSNHGFEYDRTVVGTPSNQIAPISVQNHRLAYATSPEGRAPLSAISDIRPVVEEDESSTPANPPSNNHENGYPLYKPQNHFGEPVISNLYLPSSSSTEIPNV